MRLNRLSLSSALIVMIVASILLGAASARAGSTSDLDVSVSIDKKSFTTDETAVLSITVEGTTDCDVPKIPEIKGLSIRYSGPSTQVYWTNGQVSQSVSFRYHIRSSEAGTYTIPPVEIRSKGKTYRTDPLEIEVMLAPVRSQPGSVSRQSGPSQSQTDSLWLVVEPEKTTVYPGESLRVKVILYVDGVRLTEVTYPELGGSVFICGEFGEPVQGKRNVDGRAVQTVEFETTISPAMSGSLTIGPASMNCEISVPTRPPRTLLDEFFSDGFSSFDSFFSSTRQVVTVKSDPVDLVVKAFPEKGRPDHFSGSVGDFHVSACAVPTNVQVGDPINLTVTISGQGNMRSVKPQLLQSSDQFKAYEPIVKSSTESEKIFEQVIVVKDPTVSEIPAVRLAYFDPYAEQYEVASSSPIPISVAPSSAQVIASQPQTGSESNQGSTRNESPTREEGLLFIKRSPGDLVRWSDPIPRSPSALAGGAIASLLLVSACAHLVWQKRAITDNRDRQNAIVFRAAMDSIDRLESGLSAANVRFSIEEARKLLTSCVSLVEDSVDAEKRQEIDAVLRQLDSLRYSPLTLANDEVKEVLDMCRSAIANLSIYGETVTRLSTRKTGAFLLIGLTVMLSSQPIVHASPDLDAARECFYRGNTQYQNCEYALAVDSYEEAIAVGYASGNLLFNLGNAYAKTGRYANALLSYLRAAEFIPRDQDLKHNMEVVCSELGLKNPPSPEGIAGIIKAFSVREWSYAVLLAYILFSLLIAWRLVLHIKARPSAFAVVAAICILLAATSGALYRTSLYLNDPRSVVVSDQAQVRFEPDVSAPARYSVTAGDILWSTGESTPDFLMVRDSTGQTGWVERTAVAPLKLGGH